MSTTIADRIALAPTETWDERDTRLTAQRREAEQRKEQATADSTPHEPGNETPVMAWLEDGHPIEAKWAGGSLEGRCDAGRTARTNDAGGRS